MKKTKKCKHRNKYLSRWIEICEHGIEGIHYYCCKCGKCVDNHAKLPANAPFWD